MWQELASAPTEQPATWNHWNDDTPGTPDPYESTDYCDQLGQNGQGQMPTVGVPSMIPMYSVSQSGTAPYMMFVPVAANCVQNSNYQQPFSMQSASDD